MKKRLTKEEVFAVLKREIRLAGSQAAFADSKGMSRQYLTDILRGRRDLSEKILEALGLERVVAYQRRETV